MSNWSLETIAERSALEDRRVVRVVSVGVAVHTSSPAYVAHGPAGVADASRSDNGYDAKRVAARNRLTASVPEKRCFYRRRRHRRSVAGSDIRNVHVPS